MSEQQLPENNSAVESISFGIEGLLSGFVFVFLVLLTLNYFKIISLSSFYAKLSILPQEKLSVEEKAEKAGYKIIWKGSVEDDTGRAVLTSNARLCDSWADEFGWGKIDLFGITDNYRAMGTFNNWENISNSNDYYVLLTNPLNKDVIKARILIDKSSLSSAVNSKSFEGGNRTRLEIEDLNNNCRGNSIFSKRAKFFYEITEKERNNIIKKGDVIRIYAITLTESESAKSGKITRLDSNNIPVIFNMMIRRFDTTKISK